MSLPEDPGRSGVEKKGKRPTRAGDDMRTVVLSDSPRRTDGEATRDAAEQAMILGEAHGATSSCEGA